MAAVWTQRFQRTISVHGTAWSGNGLQQRSVFAMQPAPELAQRIAQRVESLARCSHAPGGIQTCLSHLQANSENHDLLDLRRLITTPSLLYWAGILVKCKPQQLQLRDPLRQSLSKHVGWHAPHDLRSTNHSSTFSSYPLNPGACTRTPALQTTQKR